MIYLPDTNAFSRAGRGDDVSLNARFIAHRREIVLSVIVLAELEFGAEKSRLSSHRRRVNALVVGVAAVVPWTTEDAAAYGRIRANLEHRGVVIGAHDIQIAAQAIRLGAVCITHNQRHLSRVAGLKLQDWQTLR